MALVIARIPNAWTMGRQSVTSDSQIGGRVAATRSPSSVSLIPRRRNQPVMTSEMLAMNGIRQPHSVTSALSRARLTIHAEVEPSTKPEKSPVGARPPPQPPTPPPPPGRGERGGVPHRAGELAAEGEPLDQAQH